MLPACPELLLTDAAGLCDKLIKQSIQIPALPNLHVIYSCHSIALYSCQSGPQSALRRQGYRACMLLLADIEFAHELQLDSPVRPQ